MSRQIATVSSQLSATEPAVAAQLALAGYRVADTVEARSALLDTTGVRTPVRLAGPAGPLQARSTPDGGTVVGAASDGTVRLWAVGETGPSTTPMEPTPSSPVCTDTRRPWRSCADRFSAPPRSTLAAA